MKAENLMDTVQMRLFYEFMVLVYLIETVASFRQNN